MYQRNVTQSSHHTKNTPMYFNKPQLVEDARPLRSNVFLATVFWMIFLLWVTCLKFNNVEMLTANYRNLSELNLGERFMYDIVPFRTRQNHIQQWVEFFANSFLFAPFGILLNYVFAKRNVLRDVVLCFLFSLSIEVFQLYTMLGGFATVDLIMNTAGYFLGLVCYYLIFKGRTLRTCTWICFIFNILLFPVIVYIIFTTVHNWELITAILTRTL